nr:MAG TPA: hypothetical protein [Caudoviricetes sp.]
MAKRKKKKLTAKQAEYRKQQKRLERYIREGRKFGYEAQFNIPLMPSRVTEKALREIKQIKPKDIREKGFRNIQENKVYYGEEYFVRIKTAKGIFPKRSHRPGSRGRSTVNDYDVTKHTLFPIISPILADLNAYISAQIPTSNGYYTYDYPQVRGDVLFIIEELKEILTDYDKLSELYGKEHNVQELSGKIIYRSGLADVEFACSDLIEILLGRRNGYVSSTLNDMNSYTDYEG